MNDDHDLLAAWLHVGQFQQQFQQQIQGIAQQILDDVIRAQLEQLRAGPLAIRVLTGEELAR